MKKIAFVFPGQGSQHLGMGKDLPDSEKFFEKANQVLGFDLKKLCFEGPEEGLEKTEITQPAILTVSVIAYESLSIKMKPDVVAGHSLGEYTALYVAGVLSFDEAVKLVHLRGKFMQEAVPLGKGAMAAVLGLKREEVEKCCSHTGATLANINSPDQIVISGLKEEVEEASELCKKAGAKRIVPLAVSAPFHCQLMKPVAERLAVEFEKINFREAQIPVVANVSASYVKSPAEIKDSLIQQIYSPVLWEDSVRLMILDGVDTFVEIGPRQVLSGLIRKVDKNVTLLDPGKNNNGSITP